MVGQEVGRNIEGNGELFRRTIGHTEFVDDRQSMGFTQGAVYRCSSFDRFGHRDVLSFNID
jgi:hypothetical protein